MGGDPGRGQRDVLPGRGAPKTGSPGPAHPDFYLHGRACLMRVGGVDAGAAFQGWVLNIPLELSANYCLAGPGLDHPAPMSSHGLAGGFPWLCSWVMSRGPEMDWT